MLSEHPIDVMILATDLGVAREFYGDRIGLEVLIESQDFLTFTCGGDSRLVVTRSATGTSEPQTKASWRVNDLAAEVVELRSRGINVEEYDEPGLKTVDLDPARQAGARGLLRAVPHRDHRRGEHVSQSHGSRGFPAQAPASTGSSTGSIPPSTCAPGSTPTSTLAAKDTGPTGRVGSTVRPWRRSGARALAWPSPRTSAAERRRRPAMSRCSSTSGPERSRRSGATGPPRSVSPRTGVLTFE
jgi:hypothetical protein